MADPIQPVETDVAAFAGYTQLANDPALIHSLMEFEAAFGTAGYLHDSVRAFFDNGGRSCWIASAGVSAAPVQLAALQAALARLGEQSANLIAIPDAANLPLADFGTLAQAMLQQCADLQDRIAILDARDTIPDFHAALGSTNLSYGAAYFPALNNGARMVPPSGFVAGVFAASDQQHGVWKAPANIALKSVIPPLARLQTSDPSSGINEIREFPGRGILIWGARTLDTASSDWRYINVRRLMIYIEQSIRRSLQQAVFEPNASPLWEQTQLQISNFLTTLWRDGGLLGAKPSEAYFVKCGLGTTMTPDDVTAGRLIVVIGVAPVRPAEFIIITLTQLAAT